MAESSQIGSVILLFTSALLLLLEGKKKKKQEIKPNITVITIIVNKLNVTAALSLLLTKNFDLIFCKIFKGCLYYLSLYYLIIFDLKPLERNMRDWIYLVDFVG